jgi:hypothetical protein
VIVLRWMIERSDPRSALRAHSGLLGEGRQGPVDLIGSGTAGSVRSAGERTSIRVRRVAPRTGLFGEARHWDHAAARFQIGFVL